ncbi:MLO protein [Trifolium repens]|nr:MLO protein [Trifolium repens]
MEYFSPHYAHLLIIAGTVLEFLVTRRALKLSQLYDRRIIRVGLPMPPTEVHASFVLWLIQFILYQNTYQIAIFVWIGITFGFDSCMMEQLYYPVPRLIIGGFILGLCGISSLPLYTIATKELPNTAEPAQG